MSLSSDLISQFAKITKDDTQTKKDSMVYGTIVDYNGSKWVRLDGSDLLTPIESTTNSNDGDRVTVEIKNHTATVTGNISDPAATSKDVDDVGKDVSNQISEFEIIIADKVDTEQLNATNARIEELRADNVTIKGELTANKATISELEAKNVTITETLTANKAVIESLEANKLDVNIADIKYATIGSLDATNIKVNNLEATYGDFEVLTTNKFEAVEATIKELDVKSLTAEEAELMFANIDFTNIGKAAIEHLFAESGLIKDVIVGDGIVTGELVGVTIRGDLIEAGTLVADKLVILGEDGLYYKLNSTIDGITSEQLSTDEYQSGLHGEAIIANTITAEKIRVDDLVAFDATIGGFNIGMTSIFSGVKESVNNTTRGVYFGSDAQVAIGDSKQYIKYYKDEDDNYLLDIRAKKITLGSSGKDVESSIEDIQNGTIKRTIEEFYQSTSPTELVGGKWSMSQPTWTEGTYIWRRTRVIYGDNSTEYTPSIDGICITGNSGANGTIGKDGVGVYNISTQFYLSTSKTEVIGGQWVTEMPEWKTNRYLWTRSVITYTDETVTYTEPICDSSWEAIHNVSIGGRNFIRNSSTMMFEDYYFDETAMIVSYDDVGNITMFGSDLVASHDNDGNVEKSSSNFNVTYDEFGNVTL